MRFLLSIGLAVLVAFEASAKILDEDIPSFGGCYFAPMTSMGLFRMRDELGNMREFEKSERSGEYRGVNGWKAKVSGQKASVIRPDAGDGPVVYNFKCGTLVSILADGRLCRLGYPEAIIYDNESIEPLWPDVSPEEASDFGAKKTFWRDDGRIRLWFNSPNQCGVFFSFLFLAFLAITLRFRLSAVRIASGLVATSAFAVLVATGSRSGMIGMLVGSLAIAAAAIYRRFGFRLKVFAVVGMAIVLLFAASVGLMYVKARSAKGDLQSDATRCELYVASLKMMHDAPGGFESCVKVGAAYTYWYQDVDKYLMRLNLVSDQLTELVRLGWPMRFFWVLGWVVVILILGGIAFHGGPAAPVAVWLSFAIGSSLNNIMLSALIWTIPVAMLALGLGFVCMRWRVVRRMIAFSCLTGIVVATIVVTGFYLAGSHIRVGDVPVEFENSAVMAGNRPVSVWIVDDASSLGLVATTRDIRRFLKKFPYAPGIGYVKGISSLAGRNVDEIVLAGNEGLDFIERFEKGSLPFATPKKIVFIAPSFPPTAVPEELRKISLVKYVIGEFYARYFPECNDDSQWIVKVKGAEVYIPNWLGYALLAIDSESPRK